MRDQTILFVDLARFILGVELVELFVAGASMVDPAMGEAGDIDTWMVMLRTHSGALCLIYSSGRTSYGYDERLEVFGSEGIVESERQRPPRRFFSRVRQNHAERPASELVRAHGVALRLFARHLRHGSPARRSPPGPADALNSQCIAEAAVKSLKENRPIRVEDI